jgi:hypothetical protein
MVQKLIMTSAFMADITKQMKRAAPIKSSCQHSKRYQSINESNSEVNAFDIKEGLAYFSLNLQSDHRKQAAPGCRRGPQKKT